MRNPDVVVRKYPVVGTVRLADMRSVHTWGRTKGDLAAAVHASGADGTCDGVLTTLSHATAGCDIMHGRGRVSWWDFCPDGARASVPSAWVRVRDEYFLRIASQHSEVKLPSDGEAVFFGTALRRKLCDATMVATERVMYVHHWAYPIPSVCICVDKGDSDDPGLDPDPDLDSDWVFNEVGGRIVVNQRRNRCPTCCVDFGYFKDGFYDSPFAAMLRRRFTQVLVRTYHVLGSVRLLDCRGAAFPLPGAYQIAVCHAARIGCVGVLTSRDHQTTFADIVHAGPKGWNLYGGTATVHVPETEPFYQCAAMASLDRVAVLDLPGHPYVEYVLLDTSSRALLVSAKCIETDAVRYTRGHIRGISDPDPDLLPDPDLDLDTDSDMHFNSPRGRTGSESESDSESQPDPDPDQ